MGKVNPCAWWHQPPERMAPLAALRITAEHLERGIAVPPEAAAIVSTALRAYLDGVTSDLTGALGLRPRRGGRNETPLALERMRARDADILRIYQRQEGSKSAKAERVAQLMSASPESLRVTEQEMFAYLLQLHQDHGDQLPTSMRQVLRVVDRAIAVEDKPDGK